MNSIADYAKTRNVAMMITIIVLVLGTVVYFATIVADRNNEMMYKQIYGENATIKNGAINVNTNDTVNNVKTALV